MDNLATEFVSPVSLHPQTQEDAAKALLNEFDISKLSDKPKVKQPKATSSKQSSESSTVNKSVQKYPTDIFDNDDGDENVISSDRTTPSSDDTNNALPMKNKTEQRLFELQLRINKARQEAKLAIQEEAKVLNEFGQPIVPPPSGSEPQKKPKKQEVQEAGENDNKDEKPEHGMDSDRCYRLHQTMEVLDKKEKARKRKRQPSSEFDVFGDEAIFRSFHKRQSKVEFSKEEYMKQQQQCEERAAAVGMVEAAGLEHVPSPEKVELLVAELNQQIQRRSKFSRRRAWDEDRDIHFINERNRRFNEKAARAYNKYTQDIKDSLERGTAL
jgi:pre-mRNA-splicing factor SYF2